MKYSKEGFALQRNETSNYQKLYTVRFDVLTRTTVTPGGENRKGVEIDVKDAKSYFSKFSSLFPWKNHLSKDVNFKFRLKCSSRLDLQSNSEFCILHLTIILLCKCNYGYHNQPGFHTNIFQTEHFSAVKFAMVYEKNIRFIVTQKSPKVIKNSWKDRTGPSPFNLTK